MIYLYISLNARHFDQNKVALEMFGLENYIKML